MVPRPHRSVAFAEATEKAKRLVDGHAVELWSGERLVVRIEAATK
jgi:hypothetical protein